MRLNRFFNRWNNSEWSYLRIFVSIFFINLFNSCNAIESLYKPGDNILELDINSFNSSTYNKVCFCNFALF